jgi:Uma2 family endonuclease
MEPRRRVQRFVPDLAIEVVSDNDKYNALLKKLHYYVECGAREAWMFSVEHRLAQRFTSHGIELLDENAEFNTPLIPGFAVSLKEVFDSAI